MPAKKSAPKSSTKTVATAKSAPAKPAAKKAAPKAAPAKPAAKPAPAKVAAKKIAAKPLATKTVKPAPIAPKTASKVVAASKAAVAKVAVKAPTPAPKTSAKIVEVAFERYSPNSGAVDLVGSFNDWKLGKNPLKRDANGLWSTKLKLKPGNYEYKYVYDGLSYEPDPDREQVPGPFGSANNLLVVT